MHALRKARRYAAGYVRYTHLSDTDNTQLYRDAQNVISLSRSTEQTVALISPFHPLSRF